MNRVKKVTVIFLCVSIMVSLFTQYAIAKSSMLTNGIYLADNGTMNSYKDVLINEKNGSRYAGRIWTDKSVFTKNLSLSIDNDGYEGTIVNNSDFLHAFSILGSSVQQNSYSSAPVDLVIALDMSASMAQDTRYPISGLYAATDGSYAPKENRTMKDRINHSRIQKTIDAVNSTIEQLMALNKNNRISIVVYGAGASVIMPLSHYEKVDKDTPYLSVGGMETIYTLDDLTYDETYGWLWTRNIDACFTIEANAKKDDNDNPTFTGPIYHKVVSNNVKNTKVKARPGYEEQNDTTLGRKITNENENLNELYADNYVGYFTNTQGGFYLAYSQLALEEKTTYEVTLSNNKKEILARIPAAIILSDGSTNFGFNKMDDWKLHYGDYGEVYHNEWNQDWPYFRSDDSGVNGFDTTDFSHRLNENVGDEWYNVYIPGIEDDNEITSLYNSGMGREDGTLTTSPAWNHSGILYSTNDDILATSGTVLEYLLTASYMKNVVTKHYEESWDKKGALEVSKIPFTNYTMIVNADSVNQNERFRLYPTMDPKNHPLVLNANWWDDTKKFGPEITLYGDLVKKSTVFNGMINSWNDFVSGKTATANMAGASVKINISPIPEGNEYNAKFGVTVTNEEVINNIVYNDGFYDISSDSIEDIFEEIIYNTTNRAFIPIAGVNDDGVADSLTYNDPIGKYMEVKDNAVTIDGKTYDMALLLFGELHGIVKTGIYDYNFNKTHRGPTHKSSDLKESFTMGWYDKDGNYLGNTGSWDNGDTYYLDNDTIKQYVPTIDETGNMDAEQLSKTYVVYRFNEDTTERNKERKNISYGENGNVIYKFSDIRIWVERDKSKKEYNNILYANLPATTIPLQVAYVQYANTDSDKVESYDTNLDNKPSSTPLRLFYGVGLDDEILINNNEDIDLTKISEDYIKEHTSKDGYLEFYSNYYSNTPYDGYTADIYDAARTRGDAITTFSPSETNRYYVYQKNLKLYKHAYLIGDNGEIIKEDSPKLFEGADFDGELPGKTEGNLPDEEAQKAIKEAYNNGELKPGDIITLKDDAIKYGEKPSSDDYYYFVIDYVVPTGEGKGETELYVVSRKGSEFGSGILQEKGDKIPIGDFLSWLDISGVSANTYNYSDTIPEAELSKGEWVLTTKIGGLRIGDLHQSVSVKDENITGTSRSYYLPIIADDLSTDGYDAILNTYLGNNGLVKYNIRKYNLPVTGGISIVIFYIIGITLIFVSLCIINRRKKLTKKI